MTSIKRAFFTLQSGEGLLIGAGWFAHSPHLSKEELTEKVLREFVAVHPYDEGADFEEEEPLTLNVYEFGGSFNSPARSILGYVLGKNPAQLISCDGDGTVVIRSNNSPFPECRGHVSTTDSKQTS